MRGMMKFSSAKLAILIMVGLLTACAQQPVNNGVPQWLFNPEVGVVASCGFHIGGRYQQEECAIQRGRERLAAEQGVEVSSIAVIKERVVNGQESVLMNKETRSNVNNKEVKAKVKEFYYDAQRDEYYVWVVPN